MSVRSLDALGDWTFGRGKNNYLTQNKEIRQNIQTRLLSFLGDCFFDTAAGIDWFNLLGSKDQTALNLAVNSTILNTEGVTSLLQLSIVLSSVRRLTISYEVATVYTGLTATDGTIQSATNYILTEDGVIITTEDGDPLVTE